MPCNKGLRAYRREYARQKREHPTVSARVLRVIVRDHLRRKKRYG